MSLELMSIEKIPVLSLKDALTPIFCNFSIKEEIVSESVISIPRSIPLTLTPILPALTPRFMSLESAVAVVV